MFQTSSKPAQRRLGGAGSATAAVLLGAGLACAGHARADEGTGFEALDTHSAAGAAPSVPAQTNPPYLAAALGSVAGRTPVQQDPVAAPLADHLAEAAPDPVVDGPGAPVAEAAPAPSETSEVLQVAAPPLPPAPPPQAAQVAQAARQAVAGDRALALRAGLAASERAESRAPQAHAARTTMASWKPVAQERLDDLRGGFDVGGLQVSFGIERSVLINGALVVSTSLTIPDVSRITANQAAQLAAALGVASGAGAAAAATVSNALAGNPVTAGASASATGSSGAGSGAAGSSGTGGSSSSTGTSAAAAGSTGVTMTSLPATAIASAGTTVTTNGALSLIQNGPGNSVATGALAGTPATVIQNTLNNQSIQNLVTISAGVNTLQAFRAQVANATLNSALLNAAGRH